MIASSIPRRDAKLFKWRHAVRTLALCCMAWLVFERCHSYRVAHHRTRSAAPARQLSTPGGSSKLHRPRTFIHSTTPQINYIDESRIADGEECRRPIIQHLDSRSSPTYLRVGVRLDVTDSRCSTLLNSIITTATIKPQEHCVYRDMIAMETATRLRLRRTAVRHHFQVSALVSTTFSSLRPISLRSAVV